MKHRNYKKEGGGPLFKQVKHRNYKEKEGEGPLFKQVKRRNYKKEGGGPLFKQVKLNHLLLVLSSLRLFTSATI